MKTSLLMSLSALLIGVTGLVCTFMPEELIRYCSVEPNNFVMLAVQACGALYVAFAIMNWVSRDGLIGGIYQRPLVMGNLLHFVMVALVLIKSLMKKQLESTFWILAALYMFFAIWFTLVLYSNPLREKQTT